MQRARLAIDNAAPMFIELTAPPVTERMAAGARQVRLSTAPTSLWRAIRISD
jgi:hypothetical protein